MRQVQPGVYGREVVILVPNSMQGNRGTCSKDIGAVYIPGRRVWHGHCRNARRGHSGAGHGPRLGATAGGAVCRLGTVSLGTRPGVCRFRGVFVAIGVPSVPSLGRDLSGTVLWSLFCKYRLIAIYNVKKKQIDKSKVGRLSCPEITPKVLRRWKFTKIHDSQKDTETNL